MKKIVTTLAMSLALLALFSSCNKEQKKIIPETTNQDVNRHNLMSHAREFNEYTLDDMRTYSEDMQREIFAEMNTDNQAKIWQERIEDAINKATEAGEDATIISSMKDLEIMITPAIYDENNGAAIDAWAEKSMVVMGYEKTKDLLTTLGGSVEPSETPTGGGGGGTSPTPTALGCNCNQTHDYCGGVNTNYGKCSGMRTCSGSSHGCGNIWLNTCNGICVDVYVPHDL